VVIALHLGEEWEDRSATVELFRARGDDDQHAGAAQVPGQERQQVARRGIRPLDVFGDEHHRRLDGEALEEPKHQLEQAGRSGGIRQGPCGRIGNTGTDLGQEPRKLTAARPDEGGQSLCVEAANETPKGFDERAIGRATGVEFDAGAAQHARPTNARDGGEPFEQGRLAHAGLATHDDRPAGSGSGVGQRSLERCELDGAPDEPPGLCCLDHLPAIIRGGRIETWASGSSHGQWPAVQASMPAACSRTRSFDRARQSMVLVAPSVRLRRLAISGPR
jgi:hypothetical protein